jgi:hypothetical protein
MGRATILLSVLKARHGSLDSTPAQDFASSLEGLKDAMALWRKYSITRKPSQTRGVFSRLGIAPFLGDQVSTGLEVKGLGDLRQVVQPGQMDALKILVDQDFSPAQKYRELPRL